MDWITNADFKILYFIHDNLSCGFMDFIMPKITYLTEMGAVWILGRCCSWYSGNTAQVLPSPAEWPVDCLWGISC